MLTLLRPLHLRWGLALAMAATLLATPVAHAELTPNANGTVTDTTTHLVWDQCAYGLTGAACASDRPFYGDWDAALTQASAANTAVYKGFSDWRVPNKNELESIVKRDTSSPAIDATAFPNTPTSAYFSTSTTYALSPVMAWVVHFNDGNTGSYPKSNSKYVRLVRSGQSFAPFDVLLPVVNGSCGSAHATTPLVTTAPSGGALCTTGTATSVTSGTSAFTWSCTGTNSGSTPACSASRGYTVTASAGANGSISLNGSQVVAHNATPAFTLIPNTGYAASATGCGGTLSGNTYTTAAVTADCAVSASFTGNDSTPDAFSFTAANGVALGTVQTSNSITVAGITTAANISIAGGEYSINSGAPTSTAGTVNNGDTIAVRHTSSGAHSTATTTTLTIGGVSANFVSTTVVASPVNGSCGSAHSPSLVTSAPSTNLCAAGTATSVTAGTSAYTWSCTGTNSGSTANCSASRGYTVTASAGAGAANGSISPSTPQVVAHNATPAFTLTPNTGYAASATGCGGTLSGNTYTIAAVTADCAVSASFTGNDSTPDAFSFTAANGVALGTVQTSNSITVAGINTAANISVTGGEYQIGNGAFTSAAGTVNNGDNVVVRHTSSGAHSTAATTTLTIGGVSAQFVSTTAAATLINGSCGNAHSPSLVSSAPSTNLCAAGTASSVTSSASAYTWSCAGSNSGTTANCSASRGYTVTASAGANGSISPSTQQVVAHNATPAFTATPAANYAVNAWAGTCGGTASGTGNVSYTSAAVTTDCTVSVSFSGTAACGSAANVATAFLPTANLCSAGTASTATPGTSSWAWSCAGTGPSAATATCSAPYPPVVSGGGTVGAVQTPGTNGWQINQAASGFVALPAPAPVGVTFPGGATKVVLNTGTAGTSTTVTLRFSSIPVGAQLYKYGKENGIGDTDKWFAYPATIDVAAGTVTYTLTDGQRGDNDWTANSVIDDPVALAAPAAAAAAVAAVGVESVPTLGEWAMLLLAVLMGLMGWGVLAGGARRREVTRNRVGF